jgi:hypothetical protein
MEMKKRRLTAVGMTMLWRAREGEEEEEEEEASA